MKKYSVSIVNYLNAALFVEGLNRTVGFPIDLHLDNPANSAEKLLKGEVDIALAPVAILPQLTNPHIISDYCIGTHNVVKTVKVFSDVPIEEIECIYLDYQSRTSVQLTKILCKHYWKINPKLLPAYPGFQKDIVGSNAGLIIGDRAIRVLGKYQYEYDLGEEWYKWQNLPFVFAVWIANKEIDEEWKIEFNKCLKRGLTHKYEIINKYKHLDTQHFSVASYVNENISYNFDSAKQKALDIYLSMIEA